MCSIIPPCRNYFILFGRKVRKGAGKSNRTDEATRILNILELLFDKEQAQKILEEAEGAADETYPTRKGEKGKHRSKNKRLKREGKKEEPYPKGFTVASSYSANHKMFLSLLISKAPFNRGRVRGKILFSY